MRALAITAACFALAGFSTPALAFGHAGGVRASGPHGPGMHGHFGGHEHYFGLLGGYVPQVAGPPVAAEEAPPAQTPVADIPPAPRCPVEAPVLTTGGGPHIIYIGHRPTISANAPKVIYGTN